MSDPGVVFIVEHETGDYYDNHYVHSVWTNREAMVAWLDAHARKTSDGWQDSKGYHFTVDEVAPNQPIPQEIQKTK